MRYEIPYTDAQIINALDCCMERPNRKCLKCPLFDMDSHDKCDNLAWYAWCVIMNQRKEIKELKDDGNLRSTKY